MVFASAKRTPIRPILRFGGLSAPYFYVSSVFSITADVPIPTTDISRMRQPPVENGKKVEEREADPPSQGKKEQTPHSEETFGAQKARCIRDDNCRREDGNVKLPLRQSGLGGQP